MQSAKGLHFAFSACGFGRLLLLDEVVPLTADAPCIKTPPMLRLAFSPSFQIFRLRLCLYLPAGKLFGLQAGQVSAVRLRSGGRLPQRRISRRRNSYLSEKHFRVKAKGNGLALRRKGGFSWTITRTFGSRFTRPIRTLLAAARKSIEPKPVCALSSGGFIQVSDKDNGAPGTLGNIGKAEHGAHSFALFMSVFSPMYACMGSRIITAPRLPDSSLYGSSERESPCRSHQARTRSRSASAQRRGLMLVSSSAVW